MKINVRQLVANFAFFILTISNAKYLADSESNSAVLYIGLALLSVASFMGWIKASKKNKICSLKYFFVTIVLFCLGIFNQQMNLVVKVRLCISMLFIANFAIFGQFIFKSFSELFSASKAILLGCCFSFLLSIATGTSLGTRAYDVLSIFSMGFNGGLQHKNYFAATMVICIISSALYYRYEKRKRNILLLLIIEIFFLFISASRGGYLILLFYLAIESITLLNIVSHNQRKFVRLIVLFLFIVIAYEGYRFIMDTSSTYMYRIRGLTNYIDLYKTDFKVLFWGMSGIAYSGDDYGTTIRSVVGWDGTVELTVLNILIKNGIIGLAMYITIFIKYLLEYIKEKNNMLKISFIAVWFTVIASTLVENYMVNTHVLFGPFAYCMLASFSNYSRENGRRNRVDKNEFK